MRACTHVTKEREDTACMAREDAAYTLWQPSSFAASAASLSAMLFRSGSAGRWPWRVCTSRPDGICRKGATATGCNIILTSTPFGGAAATRALRAPTQAAMKTQLPFWSCLGGSKKWERSLPPDFFPQPIDPCRGVAARRAGVGRADWRPPLGRARLRFGGSLRAWVDEAV